MCPPNGAKIGNCVLRKVKRVVDNLSGIDTAKKENKIKTKGVKSEVKKKEGKKKNQLPKGIMRSV